LQPECPQCGLMHPQIPHGTICPLVKQKDADGKEIDFAPLMGDLKQIISEYIKENNLNREEQQLLFDNILLTIQNFLKQKQNKEHRT
jgi:hypothetical protein